MFGWLANLLVKAPIVGYGCACCEAKKEQLKQMQKVVLKECFDIEDEKIESEACCCHSTSQCRTEFEQNPEEMHSSLHYKL